MIDEVNQYDRVVYDNTGEHDQADKHHDADSSMRDKQREDCANQCQGNAEHDHQWMDQRFKLRGHDQIDEKDRQTKRQLHRFEGRLHFQVLAGHAYLHICRQGH